MRRKVTMGSTWGALEVLSDAGHYTEPSGKQRQKFNVRCTLCGYVFEYPGNYLLRTSGKRGYGLTSCKKCHFDQQRAIKIGDVFDQLTVIGYVARRSGSRDSRDTALCRCSCGNEVSIRLSSLTGNKTNNCGCRARGHWEGFGDISLTYFNRTKRGAAIRGLAFNVSMQELWELYQSQQGMCALTGLPISLGVRTKDEMTGSLDRIDSIQGYTISNVQWVHKDVNRMKQDFPQKRFFDLCRLVTSLVGSK